MNKKFLLIITLLGFFTEAKPQDRKHITGLSYGFQYKTSDIWVGDSYNIWIDQVSSSIIEGFYYYKLAKHFQVGIYDSVYLLQHFS